MPVPVCVTVKVFPAMVNVPVRGAASLFGDTEKLALPLPVPLPEVITIQSSLLTLDQVHLLSGVVTETLPVPLVDGNGSLVVGVIE
jgi:hypothetical protein